MRALVQRVARARVVVENDVVGAIDRGLLIFLGITGTDSQERSEWLAAKLVSLRIFNDQSGKMNRSIVEIGGEVLVVSQFTLYGDCLKGRRPSFVDAAPPDIALSLYEGFLRALRALGIRTATGRFGVAMSVELVNDGPVTFFIEAK